MCPLVKLHPSSGDGQTDVSRAVPSCDSKSDLHLPSALLPRLLPHPLPDLDFVDFNALALDPATSSYFMHSDGVDPDLLDAPDTNDDCILDFSDDDGSVDSDGSGAYLLPPYPLHLHHLLSPGLPSPGDPTLHVQDDVPDSPLSALYGLDHILCSLDVS